MIFVRNNTGIAFADRYDGVDHVFPVGEMVECSEDAARHIFGYGQPDKTQNMIRLGWAATTGGIAAAYERLAKFEFLQGRIVVEEPMDETILEHLQEDPAPKKDNMLNPPANNLLAKIGQLTD